MSKKQLAADFAFPTLGYSQGLTKRELFAAMAMQGYCNGALAPVAGGNAFSSRPFGIFVLVGG